ncbi:MAG: nicotinate-nucleotide--dimethylbenzimidazole phosphoribosyltransferase, partial [Janthinobacterium sp.]
MADLFSTAPRQPLAEALRPATLNEVIGQTHLLGVGKPLRLAFEAGKAHSMILWGPPGVGKTTLARLMANAFDSEFIALSAVFAGVKDIRAAMDQARARQQQLTKPAGSLGQLEGLAIQLAGLQGRERPTLDQAAISIFAG